MSEREANDIWNRACSPESERLRFPGDRALTDMIFVHSLIMNGGVHHVIEGFGKEKMIVGIAGYRYFKLISVADFLADILDDPAKVIWNDTNELEANRRYDELVPDDEILITAFDTALGEHPHDFEPVNY